ncbi:MAG: FecR family protein [Rhodoferax sp.]
MKLFCTGWVLLLGACLSLVCGVARAEQVTAGYVTRLNGEVLLVTDAKWNTLLLGNGLFLGSRIITGANARLEARMRDGSVLTLGERTEFVIEQVMGTKSEARGSSFSLLKGAFRAITGKPADNRSAPPWQVRTPVAIIGVRGTELWGGLNLLGAGDDTLDVVMLEGRGVYVENSSGQTELAQIGAGTTVSGTGVAPGKMVVWGDKKLSAALQSVGW